jgi:putative endonuclease
MGEKQGYVYLITNKTNSVIYTGVTSDLKKRIYEHKEKLIEGFTKKYNIQKLVYFETHDDITNAILREKQIKGGSRAKKLKMTRLSNPEFRDLYYDL